VANSAFFFSLLFFGEVFGKKKRKSFKLVVGYFQILQECEILQKKKTADCKKRNTIKK
jgi:hypothetical protein